MKILPGFKTTFVTIGILQTLLACVFFIQGAVETMAQFQIPAEVLNSPQYIDAISYVFIHQFVLGCILTFIGFMATDPKFKTWLPRLLVPLYGIYTYFDFRATDTVFGNALYKGDASVIPALFSLVFMLFFLQLAVKKT